MLPLPGPLASRARRLEWLLFDVDGVLNDGRLYYTSRGESIKVFHVRDGLATVLARRRGLKVGLLSGRTSPALKQRALELGVDELMLERTEKDGAFDAFLRRRKTSEERVGYVGDDLLDLPVLLRAGLSFAPADAVAEVRDRVHRVLESRGGGGVAREVVELVLGARGEWDELVAGFAGAP